MFVKIDDKLISAACLRSRQSGRRRVNHNFHLDYNDPVQRLLNAAQPDTYIQPHKHQDPDKTEVFVILKGRIVVVEFDDKGNVVDHVVLDEKGPDKGVEIPAGAWHTFIVLENDSVVYEVKNGPYVKTEDKNFASWAPAEGAGGAKEFNTRILRKLGF